MTKKEQLMKLIDNAFENGKVEGVNLLIRNAEMNLPEEIYNPVENLRCKQAYIKKAYDDELHLKANPRIHIVHFYHVYYRTIGSFGWAIQTMKMGARVRRRGWNGKNQYIELASNISYVAPSGEHVNAEHDAIGNNAVAFVGTSGVQLGWLASQADMLANDWEIAE